MVDPKEVKIAVHKPAARKRRRPWWGFIGLLFGICLSTCLTPSSRPPSEPSRDALNAIYTIISCAVIGFAIEVIGARRRILRHPMRFGLRDLFALCYVAAVVVYIIKGVLTLHRLP